MSGRGGSARRRRKRLLLLALGYLAASACNPHTEYRSLPEGVRTAPPKGPAIYAAMLPGVRASVDGEVVPPDSLVTRSYVRTLRRAGVFTEVEGPGSPPRAGSVRIELENALRIDDRPDKNLTRSVLIGASLTLLRPLLPYQVEVEGDMELGLELPGTGKVLRYRAETRATRYYYYSENYESARQHLVQEVTNANLRSVIAQMRAAPSLTAAPEFDPGL